MRIAVIGGGASGMAAAISSAEKGAKVTVLEKNDRLGKKILATGNGRCNFTNINIGIEHYISEDIDIVKNIIEKVDVDSVLNFFKDIGVEYAVESGRVYPRSFQASAVLDALRLKMKFLEIKEFTGFDVSEINKTGNSFEILSKDGKSMKADKVIISAGGCAYPNLGTDGSVYKILKRLGHEVHQPYPALVPLKVKGMDKSLQGVRAKCTVKALCEKELLQEEKGEVQFTDYGLSGIAVMQCSYLYHTYDNLKISLDFFPEYAYKELFDFIENRKETFLNMDGRLEDFFTGLIHKKLGTYILRKCNAGNLSQSVGLLNKNMIHKITDQLKNMEFEITDTKGYAQAQVSGGGAVLCEFDKNTLESKKVRGLYCCGEVLDVIGDCGGYNLHWAWISGLTAGGSAAIKE